MDGIASINACVYDFIFLLVFFGGLPVLSMTLVRGIQSDVGDFYYVC